MKIKHLAFVLFVFVLFKVHGQALTLPTETFDSFGGNNYFKFSANSQIEMGSRETGADRSQKSGTYSLTRDNGIDFLNVRWSNAGNEKFLYLMADSKGESKVFLFLYKQDGEPYFMGGKRGRTTPSYYPTYLFYSITASSYLTENGREYSTDKLGQRIGECWVEGVPGNGIGEKLIFEDNFGYSGNPLYISSGFVSYSKPNLYRENSRIKKIKITNQSGKSIVVELSDTPHFQTIDLSQLFSGYGSESTYILEIVEVYPGTKYTDTCVNSIYGLSVAQ